MKNKKLFAILTLVAFMLTMMPVMAFGAASTLSAYGDVEKASVLAGNGVAKFSLTIPGYDEEDESVRVFFTIGKNEILAPTTVEVSIDGADPVTFNPNNVLPEGDTFDFVVQNTNAGQFTINAYIVKGTDHDQITNAQILNGFEGANKDILTSAITWDTNNTLTFRPAGSVDALFTDIAVSVEDGTPLAAVVSKEVYSDGSEKTSAFGAPAGEFLVKRVYSDTLAANNGLYYYEVTGKLTKGAAAVKNTEITAEFNKVGAFVNKDVIETNARGIFKFNVYASKSGVYTLNLSANGAEDLQLVFNFDSSSVDSVVPTPVTGHFATGTPIFVDLTVKDANGNVLSAADAIAEFVSSVPREFVVVKSPEDSTRFVADDAVTFGTPDVRNDLATGTFTATINPTTGNAALRITVDAEGDYTFKMYEDVTGRDVQYINVSAKEFEKAVQATVAYKSNTYYLGSEVGAPTITLIDANGTKSTLEDNSGVEIAYTGVGVTGWVATGNNAGAFKVVNDEKFLGKEIVVTAVAEKCFATTTLKIADAPAYLKFTEVTAPVGTEATVPVVSLDLNGGMAALGAVDNLGMVEVTPVVTSKPANAIVSVDATSNMANFAKTGKGAIKVASNKPGTVTVNVIVKADTNTATGAENVNWVYLTGIATVNFGEEATPVQQSATLIIGSNVFVANGGVQTAPAAPAIIDGRTYLPIRAVGQAIGAQVDYVDGVITLTLGAQKATMVPGSNVMTIGTETVTMDAAPYLAGDGHTMVPVRYAAQAFGYELGITTNADGSVATVTVFK